MTLTEVLTRCNLTTDDLKLIEDSDIEAIIEAEFGFGYESDIALDLIFNFIG